MDTICTSIAALGIAHADGLAWLALGLGLAIAVALALVARRLRATRSALACASVSAALAATCAALSLVASVQPGPTHARASTPAQPAYVLLAPNALASPWAATAHAGDWSGLTGVQPGAVRPHARDGKLPAPRIGGHRGDDLQKLLHDQEHQQLPAPSPA